MRFTVVAHCSGGGPKQSESETDPLEKSQELLILQKRMLRLYFSFRSSGISGRALSSQMTEIRGIRKRECSREARCVSSLENLPLSRMKVCVFCKGLIRYKPPFNSETGVQRTYYGTPFELLSRGIFWHFSLLWVLPSPLKSLC